MDSPKSNVNVSNHSNKYMHCLEWLLRATSALHSTCQSVPNETTEPLPLEEECIAVDDGNSRAWSRMRGCSKPGPWRVSPSCSTQQRLHWPLSICPPDRRCMPIYLVTCLEGGGPQTLRHWESVQEGIKGAAGGAQGRKKTRHRKPNYRTNRLG